VLTFLCAGIYLLGDAVANPLAAQAATLIGAFIIALATILLFYLLRPDNGRPGLGGNGRDTASCCRKKT
jgi:hypothetical protein